MPRDATMHVKLDSETDAKLKKLAYEQGKSKGQLVREAISACYQTELDSLPIKQQHALSAYQGGYISIGKLAREMGMHVLEVRHWLADRNSAQHTSLGDEDAANA